MADTYEKDLSQKSSLTVSDFIRVVGSDNVSYKQLVSDVAKKVIEVYAGSTLGGSAQSVKSAIDSLNSKTAQKGTSTVSFVDAEGISTGAAKIADNFAANISSHFGQFELASDAGIYGVLTSGQNTKYFAMLIFGYNDRAIHYYVYRNGTYYAARLNMMGIAW